MTHRAAPHDPGYTADDEEKSLWVYLENGEGRLAPVSLEILGKARELADRAGWPLVALLCGHDVTSLAAQAREAGADEIVLIEDPLLAEFTVDAYAAAVCQAVTHRRPSILLAGATPNGRDLAGRLAVRLRTGLNADCTALDLDPTTGRLTSEVTGFGGGVLAMLAIPVRRPQMATVRPGVFPPARLDPHRTGRVTRLASGLRPEDLWTRVVERQIGEQIDLTQAKVLVCGGRGIDGDFALLRELADLLGGDVGATRPPVDQGYIERERQVGQTGLVCRPKIAFALGISGAFHFVVGIEHAEVVVAVNLDPDAPIFEAADFGIVGDVAQIVPALVRILRAEREPVHA